MGALVAVVVFGEVFAVVFDESVTISTNDGTRLEDDPIPKYAILANDRVSVQQAICAESRAIHHCDSRVELTTRADDDLAPNHDERADSGAVTQLS